MSNKSKFKRLTGFMAGIFGMGGAIRSLFLSAFNLPKEVYIVTGAAIAIFIDISRLGTYLLRGTSLEKNSKTYC